MKKLFVFVLWLLALQRFVRRSRYNPGHDGAFVYWLCGKRSLASPHFKIIRRTVPESLPKVPWWAPRFRVAEASRPDRDRVDLFWTVGKWSLEGFNL